MGGVIPIKNSCDGEKVSPQLSWTGMPAEAVSIVLIVDDPDAPLFFSDFRPGSDARFTAGITHYEAEVLLSGKSWRWSTNGEIRALIRGI